MSEQFKREEQEKRLESDGLPPIVFTKTDIREAREMWPSLDYRDEGAVRKLQATLWHREDQLRAALAAPPPSPSPQGVEIPKRPMPNSTRVTSSNHVGRIVRPVYDNDIANEHFDRLERIILSERAQQDSRVREAEEAAYRRAAELAYGAALDAEANDKPIRLSVRDCILSLIPAKEGETK